MIGVGILVGVLLADAGPLALPYGSVPLEHFKKVCAECQAKGERSTVYPDGSGTCTLAYCGGGHWDEDGDYRAAKPCNSCSQGYRCSRGHTWSEAWSSY